MCLVLGATSALADPVWVPPKGTIHGGVSYTHGNWDQFLELGSDSVNLPGEITQHEFTLYGEYVPLENVSFDIVFPIVSVQRKFVYLTTDLNGNIIGITTGGSGELRDVDENTGIGDVYLGGKYIFWEKGLSLGVRPYLKFPGTYHYGNIPNAPGDGQTDMGLGLLAGSYFQRIRTYVRGSFTLVQRFGDPHNQMEFMIEPGVNITKIWGARFTFQHIEQFGGQDLAYYNFQNYYPAIEEDSGRIGVGMSLRASDQITVYGLYQQTIYGRNTANTQAFTIGLDFSF